MNARKRLGGSSKFNGIPIHVLLPGVLVTVYAGEETKKKFGQLQNYLVSTYN